MSKRKREEDGTKEEVKYKGVTKIGKRFKARLKIDGKMQGFGTFDTPKEAAQAYDCAAIQAGHPTSKLNFLDQVPKNHKPKNNGLHSTNTTGYRGVSKKGNRFQGKIRISGTQQCIGTYDTAKEAAIAYDLAAIQAKHRRDGLNFPFLHDCPVVEKFQKNKEKKNYKLPEQDRF